MQVLLLTGSDDTRYSTLVLFPAFTSEKEQLHLIEYVVLSNGKNTAALSLTWLSNIASQNIFFYYSGSLQQTSGLVIPKREMLDSIVTRFSVLPFFLHTREEQDLPYLFLF